MKAWRPGQVGALMVNSHCVEYALFQMNGIQPAD